MQVSLLRCFFVFGVMGPLVGLVCEMLFAGLEDLGVLSPILFGRVLIQNLVAAVFVWPGAVVVGGIPALATGVLYWLWRRRVYEPKMWEAAGQAALMGSIACLVFAAIVEGPLVLASTRAWYMYVLPGVFAGPLCALALEWSLRRRTVTPVA
jgi:hypothetical protein